jgi:hypothetical protein
MRKRIIGHGPREVAFDEYDWLDLESLAQVGITSEDVDHPIESAFIPGAGPGWRAAQPGEQKIRLRFDEPLRLQRLRHCSMKMSRSAPKSSFYGGHQTAVSRPGSLCASSITSTPCRRHVRSKNTTLISTA